MEPCCQSCHTPKSECFNGPNGEGRGGWVEAQVLHDPAGDSVDQFNGSCWECHTEAMELLRQRDAGSFDFHTGPAAGLMPTLELAETVGSFASTAMPDRQHALSLAQGWHFDRGGSSTDDVVATAQRFAAFLEGDVLPLATVEVRASELEPIRQLLEACGDVLTRVDGVAPGHPIGPGLAEQVRDVLNAIGLLFPAAAAQA